MADPESIYNWRRLDDRITTSGQPTEPQLADIHELGVRHIINLGPAAVDTGREWSDGEPNELGDMLVRGVPMEEIARRLRRDHGGRSKQGR
jgi:protein tyrosine phosphatase (PTP) superfamily phosphohydrolase (DUF442 family)